MSPTDTLTRILACATRTHAFPGSSSTCHRPGIDSSRRRYQTETRQRLDFRGLSLLQDPSLRTPVLPGPRRPILSWPLSLQGLRSADSAPCFQGPPLINFSTRLNLSIHSRTGSPEFQRTAEFGTSLSTDTNPPEVCVLFTSFHKETMPSLTTSRCEIGRAHV